MNNKGNIDDRYVDGTAKLTEKFTGIKAVRPVPKAFRQDGSYQNALTKYGTSRDMSEYYRYESEGITPDSEIAMFYEQNGLFSRIIDAPAEEAVKHGFELLHGDEDTKMFFDECLAELDWNEVAITAIKWARLFGGSIAVMLINDGGSLEEPLNWKKIKSIDDIRIFDRSVVTPDYASMYTYDSQDLFKTRGSRLGYPERFQVSSRNGTFTVHETRCLIFQNGLLPENTTTGLYQFWGIPEYLRVHRAVRDVEIAHGMAPKMLDRSVQAIYKMKDLAQLLSTEQGEDVVVKRLNTIDMAKGLMNSMVLDAEGEDYDYKSFSYTGVSDVINTTCNYLSALTNIPQTILFGRSPAGMNATGASDMENYYNYIERIQKRMLYSNLRYLLTVIGQAAKHTGELKKVPKIDIEFNALWSMNEQERVALDLQKAQLSSTKAQTAIALIQAQVLDPSEVRREYAKDEDFDIDTMLDDYTEEELEENAPQGQDPMGGGDPMAAMMGMGGGAPEGGAPEGMPPEQGGTPEGEAPQGGQPQQPSPDEMQAMQEQAQVPQETPETQQNPSDQEEKEDSAIDRVKAYKERRAARLAKRNIGNSPDAAPEATKLPQDMQVDEEHTDEEEVEQPKDGCGVLLIQGSRFLTATRIAGDAGGYGLVGGPGGHIEDGETPIMAAQREELEVFGIVPLNMKQLSVIRDPERKGMKSYVFIASGYVGEVECDDTEMRGPVWRDLTDLYTMEEKLFKPFKASLELLVDRMYRFDEETQEIQYTPIEDIVKEICGGKDDAE